MDSLADLSCLRENFDTRMDKQKFIEANHSTFMLPRRFEFRLAYESYIKVDYSIPFMLFMVFISFYLAFVTFAHNFLATKIVWSLFFWKGVENFQCNHFRPHLDDEIRHVADCRSLHDELMQRHYQIDKRLHDLCTDHEEVNRPFISELLIYWL